ncbi:MAG: ATP-dependent metallopeptidase FtsH/Yme1/Tma family protein, partial [Bacteroidales bacterium]|nr:ATP-dependent metallopeptidase FtsH/Yme1/Tma family protein [Bacteroidales bacterium]
MSEHNNQNGNMRRKPNLSQDSPRRNKGMYVIYLLILAALGVLWFSGDTVEKDRKITWNRLEQILLQGDEERIVVVNQEFAEIFIKPEAIKHDTAYRDLANKNALGQPVPSNKFYTYQFVTFESFEKDLEEVEHHIVARDTVGVTDPDKVQQIIRNSRIDLTPEKRTNQWREIFVVLWPLLLMVLFLVLMFRMSARQMGGNGGAGGIFNVGKNKAKMYDGKTPTNVTFK